VTWTSLIAGPGAGHGARPGRDRGHLRGPGLTDIPAARAGLPAAAFDAVRARQALPRALRPDVAATVAFLASDGAAALTGQVLCTDGGLVMR
jgi:3-oxoacyl-[acyl-carrier protein] reductase